MSQENLDIVRRLFDLWNERLDPAALGESFWHEDVEWTEPPTSPEAGTVRGRAAAVRYMANWVEHMNVGPVLIEELLAADDEVVAGVRLRLQGADSGLALDKPIYYVFRLRGDRVDRIRPIYSRSEALEAAGLSE